MKQRQDRKALILLTDGVDNSSDATLTDAVEAAQRTDTLIYSILFADPEAYGFGGGTDGACCSVFPKTRAAASLKSQSRRPSTRSLREIEDELRSQYSLGFVSDQPVRSAEFRKLQVATKRKGLVVRSRDRYWATRL
jgi:VWFA-related protein